jgi:hypothetical protein
MGENVLRGQVKDFEKGRDRSLKKMAAPTLFDRPDVVTTKYTAAPVNGHRVQAGDVLHGHVSADGQCVHLADGHRTVGTISGDGARTLIDGIRGRNGSGFAPLRVTEVSAISGFFKATVDGTEGDQ